MPDLYISHVIEDDAIVARLHDELEQATGKSIWVDHRDLPDDANWIVEKHHALLNSQAGLLILSKNSVNRPEIVAEWTYLLNVNRPLYVAKVDDVPLEKIDYRLHIVQWVNFTQDWQAGVNALAAALMSEGELPESTPVFVPRIITGRVEDALTMVPLIGRQLDLEEVYVLLQQAPTMILGVGGLGKSRLAAEIALIGEYQGVIWHRVSDVSQAYQIIEALNAHFKLPATTLPADTLAALRGANRLVVIDNAEDAPADDPRQREYVRLVNQLAQHHAQVLLTSRIEWEGIRPVRRYDLTELAPNASEQLVLKMGEALDVSLLEAQATDIAQAARHHPRLIEWAIGQMRRFDVDKVVADLKNLRNKRVHDALDEMIFKTLRRMLEVDTNGIKALVALRRLLVFRGGFTYEAAQAVAITPPGSTDPEQSPESDTRPVTTMVMNLALEDDDDLDYALETLQLWRFVIRDGVRKRYRIPPMVMTALSAPNSPAPPAATASQPHYAYFLNLLVTCEQNQTYARLDPEAQNLSAAFEWAVTIPDGVSAYQIARFSLNYLRSRGRFEQRFAWMIRAGGLLNDATDPKIRASYYHNLGSVYMTHPFGERRENIQKGITFQQSALKTLQENGDMNVLVRAYGNLSMGYFHLSELSEGKARIEALKLSVAAAEDSLKLASPQTDLINYALSQNNLGNALNRLAEYSIDHDEAIVYFQRAIQAYDEAATYWTVETRPLDHAAALQNQGGAYLEMSQRLSANVAELKTDYLQRALALFQRVAQIWTAADTPVYYASLQENFGIAYKYLGDFAQAVVHWQESEQCYRENGYTHEADRIAGMIAALNL